MFVFAACCLLLANQTSLSIKALEARHAELIAEYQKALKKATTPAAQQKLVREHQQALRRLSSQYLALARKTPRSSQSVDVLIWVAAHCPYDPAASDDPRAEALDLLAREAINDEKIGPLCTLMSQAVDSASERFLRQVLAKSKQPGVQARACMTLALDLKFQARTLRQLVAEGDAGVKVFTATWGPETTKTLRSRSPERLLTESEQLLVRVQEEFSKIKHPQFGTLGALARIVSQTLRDPVMVDQPAPPLRGTDLAGKPIDLADYKGKVVLIDFDGRTLTPNRPSPPPSLMVQKELLKKLAGKPFVLLSVNADADREATRKVLAKDGVSWPVLWDGGNVGGPLATRWDVDLWPTVFLVDQKGVVKAFSAGWPAAADVEKAIQELLGPAKAKK